MNFLDRIRETTTTTGTGNITLAGAVSSFLALSNFSTNYFHYVIQHQSANEFEVGIGHLSGGALIRDLVERSSNTDALVNFSAGTKDVFAEVPATVINNFASYHAPCVAATTANITISTALNNGDVIDNTTLVTGDRVLVLHQSTASQNGIYIVGVTPRRSDDMYDGFSIRNAIVPVVGSTTFGTRYFRKLFTLTTATAKVVATDSLNFSPVRSHLPLYTESDAGTITFNQDNGRFQIVTLAGNRTLAVSNVFSPFVITLKQDGTGARTVTWWSGITWPDGNTTPTLSNAGDSSDTFAFIPLTGSTYLGFIVGQGNQF